MSGHAYTAAAAPPRSLRRGGGRSGITGALAAAAMCLLGLVLVWGVAEHVSSAQWKDAQLLHDFTLLSRPSVNSPALFLLHLLNPLQFILWGVALAALAIAQERPRVALAVCAVMGLAPLTAETLKPLLAHPHVHVGSTYVGAASWPSGHSTAAVALVLCAVLVAPVRLRLLVASVGALFVVAVSCALLILAWHMPSDVLGGYLVASLWMALAVAALRLSERHWPSRARS